MERLVLHPGGAAFIRSGVAGVGKVEKSEKAMKMSV